MRFATFWDWISKTPKLFYTFMPKIPKKIRKSFFPKKLGKGAHEPLSGV